MKPKSLVEAWVDAFNRRDADALAELYCDDAINHQVAESPVRGKPAIRQMFVDAFALAEMFCDIEHIFEDGDGAILEWKVPLGLRGCGFFRLRDGKIGLQRGDWDKLGFFRLHGLPLER